MRGHFDLSLYLVVGPAQVADPGLVPLVAAAIAGGVTMVQLRDKGSNGPAMAERAQRLLALLRPRGIPLIVNDDPHAAVAAGADGVHVGPFDRPPAEVRRLIGDTAILGLSITNASQARQADPAMIDYVGLGPVFATSTKPDAARPLGIDGLAVAGRLMPVPTVAIGGIDAGNVLDVMRAGADGVAVVLAICAATDPQAAARQLADLVRLAQHTKAETGT